MLRTLVNFVIHYKSIMSLLCMMLVLEVLFIIQVFEPKSIPFITDKHIFEVLVLLALSQMIVLLFQLTRKAPKNIIEHEHELESAVRFIIDTDNRAHSVHIFSCGLGSKINFITSLKKGNKSISVEVLAQHPDHAMDRIDKWGTVRHLNVLMNDHEKNPVETRLFCEPATLRGVLVCNEYRKPVWGVVSWYKYREDKVKNRMAVKGRDNPAFVLSTGTYQDDTALATFMEEFEWLWKHSPSLKQVMEQWHREGSEFVKHM